MCNSSRGQDACKSELDHRSSLTKNQARLPTSPGVSGGSMRIGNFPSKSELVPLAGLEPAQPCDYLILSQARLSPNTVGLIHQCECLSRNSRAAATAARFE
jgi:hypothetical protein